MAHTQDADLSLVRPFEYFDEDAAYSVERPEDPSRTTGPYKLDLVTLGEVDPDGRLRSTSEGDPNDFRVLTKDESDYCLSVDRLLWIDGWRNISGSQNDREAMTLLVLNLIFENKRGKNKIANAIAEVVFLSEDKQSENPEVVAWGPFRHEERWNPSTAEVKTNDKGSVQLAAGISGQQATLSKERGKEMSKQVIDFDQGRATRFFSTARDQKRPGDKRNGVRWTLQQNELQSQGVSPELRIAVLASRPNPRQSYRVSLRLEAGTGARESMRNMAQRASRRTVGDKIHWLTDPNQPKPNHGQGVHIAKLIDPENLGSLIKDSSDSENLDQPWLKPWRHVDLVQLVQASQSTPEVEPVGVSKISGGGEEVSGAGVHPEQPFIKGGGTEEPNELRGSLSLVAASPEPEGASVGKALPGSASGNARHSMLDSAKSWPRPRNHEDTNCHCQLGYTRLLEYDRLLGLETRAAQAEARLASQDQIIFHLQKEMAVLQKAVSGNASKA